MAERSGAMVTLRGSFESPPSVQRRVADRVQAALDRLQAQQSSTVVSTNEPIIVAPPPKTSP